ncbi:zinc finger protein 3-like [Limanda limanda]|uniref:zinc finger protein 3-like n=1 Tax=Limanda limanda TaxID=27771 RepID=UPI0029C6E5ED|nr:zinc finger protein 3-like [Limanda limanda]
MTFPSAFGSQLAAIMDVLAKAAVAEISKLVEDGTLVLRLEMCRRDVEIQELKRSLEMMEEEKARTQVPSTDEKEEEQTLSGYLEPKTADSLCKHRHGNRAGDDMRPAVKREPAGELVIQEVTDITATAASRVCFEVGEQSDSMWQQQQMFPSHPEQFPAHRNTESSYSSPTETQESAHDLASVPIKVEPEIQPVCSAGITSQSVGHEQLRLVSGENQCLQSHPQQAGRSPAVPPVPRTEDHILSRNHMRTKRLVNVWRANQKLFMCSVCNKGFPRSSQLEEHKATHQLFKPFRCLECGKSFTQKTRLKTHQSVHTGERPFSCSICGKMFSRQDNCTRHERFHSGLKPYSCGQCGKSFTVLGNLKIHQEIHLQGR